MILKRKAIVTVNVIYYRPDYRNILQEFIWQTPDEIPEMKRVQTYLKYWQENIDAIISDILVCHNFDPTWREISLYDHS
jgi:uncharacterized protein Usg